MANDALTTGVLILGGGLAGYALGQWLERRDDEPAPRAEAPPLDEPISSPTQVEQRNARGARRWSREGRTLLRDGVAAFQIVRVDLGDQRYAITPHETDVLAEQLVRLLNGRNAGGARAKTPPYRERWLVDDRCGYRAWVFWTGTPPERAVVGDAWAYLEKTSNGEITAKRRFRTREEAYRYIKPALKRALERAGKDDCHGE
jgi:hypothetical protein